MTRGLAAATANGMLDTYFPNTTYTKLHTGDPGAAGTSNAAAGDTTRKVNTFSAASGGVKSLSTATGPWTNGGTSETVTDVSIWTAVSSGTFVDSVQLTASQAWVNTNTASLTSLSITFTPIAA